MFGAIEVKISVTANFEKRASVLYLKSLSLDSLLFCEELLNGVAVRLESAALQIVRVLQEV